jgi:hypothetical protein
VEQELLDVLSPALVARFADFRLPEGSREEPAVFGFDVSV